MVASKKQTVRERETEKEKDREEEKKLLVVSTLCCTDDISFEGCRDSDRCCREAWTYC